MRIATARLEEERGNASRAIDLYLSALRLDRSRSDALLRLAILHDQRGRIEEANEAFRIASELEPDNPDICSAYGYSFYLRGRLPEAEQLLRKAIAIRPEHPKAHNNLGLVLAQSGRRTEALSEFLLGGCSGAEARSNLAFGVALSGNWTDAQRVYRNALTLDPGSAAAQSGLRTLQRIRTNADLDEPVILQTGQSMTLP